MTEPNKSLLDSISEAISPKRDDRIDALNAAMLQQSPWFSGHPAASRRGVPLQTGVEDILNTKWEDRQEQRLKLNAFKELYTKVRADNLALTHEAAIELVKMIQREADQITYADIK